MHIDTKDIKKGFVPFTMRLTFQTQEETEQFLTYIKIPEFQERRDSGEKIIDEIVNHLLEKLEKK